MATPPVQQAYAFPTYFEDEYVVVRQPEVPLALGALEIVLKKEESPEDSYRRIYGVYQRLKSYWSEPSPQGNVLAAGSYFLERRDEAAKSCLRQIIPYANGGFRACIQQVIVTWNLLCPKLAWTSHKVLGTAADLQAALRKELTQVRANVAVAGTDAFCRADRINAQKIHETEHTRLLCNFKPLTKNDNLITSKEHKQIFDETTFVEAMSLGKRVNAEYAKVGYPIGYLTMADHKFAGQTVPHAHIHVSAASGLTEELLGIATVARKILFDSWAAMLYPPLFCLSDKALQVPIAAAKETLKSLLPHS